MTDVCPGGTITSAVITRANTRIGSHSQPEPTRNMAATQPPSTTTPNQPLTAKAGRWAISTRAPWWPTTWERVGDSEVLMADFLSAKSDIKSYHFYPAAQAALMRARGGA